MRPKMKQASQRTKAAAKPAAKAAPKTSAKQTAKADTNPIQGMMKKAGDAIGNMQKSRTSMWQDYKKGYDANQGKSKGK